MNKLREEENDDLIDGQKAIIDRATPRVEKILGGDHPAQVDHSGAEEKPTRTRKQRSDKGKPKAVKQAAPTSDPAKRKHLALVEKYYALLDNRDALDASLEQVRAEINAQLTQ